MADFLCHPARGQNMGNVSANIVQTDVRIGGKHTGWWQWRDGVIATPEEFEWCFDGLPRDRLGVRC